MSTKLPPELCYMVHNSPIKLQCCSDCDVFASSGTYSTEFPWAVELCCGKCAKKWTICRLCSRSRKPISKTQCYKHHAHKHEGLAVGPLDIPVYANYQRVNEAAVAPDPVIPVDPAVPGLFHLNYDDPSIWKPESTASQDYFSCSGTSTGGARIAALCLHGSREHYDRLPICEVVLFWMLGKLVSGMTHGQRTELAGVFNQMEMCRVSRVETEKMKDPNGDDKYWYPTMPTDINTMRTRYYEGKNALFSNLPHPKMRVLADGVHAYTSPVECIADAAGHNLPVDAVLLNEAPASGVYRISDCPKAKGVRRRCFLFQNRCNGTFVWLLVEWSDDFDPMSKCMQNRGGVWAKTATLCASPEFSNSARNTYLIALGPKGADHTEIERLFASDFCCLCGGRKIYRFKFA